MLTSPRLKLPSQLARRIDELREDEGAREQLQRRVQMGQRALRKRSKPTSQVSARAQLMQKLELEHVPEWGAGGKASASAPARSSAVAGGHRASGEAPPAAAPASSTSGATGLPSAQRAKPQGHEHAKTVRRRKDAGARREVAPPPPPSMPAVQEMFERARGDRARDPAEMQGPSSAVVRPRHKRLELAGDFTFYNGSASDRLADVAARCEPLEAPVHHETRPATLPPKPGPEASKWKGGDFVQTRAEHSTISDTALLQNHRLPFLDFSEREQIALRQRDAASEIAPRRPRRLMRKLLSTRASMLEFIPTSFGDDELDNVEMQVFASNIACSFGPSSPSLYACSRSHHVCAIPCIFTQLPYTHFI